MQPSVSLVVLKPSPFVIQTSLVEKCFVNIGPTRPSSPTFVHSRHKTSNLFVQMDFLSSLQDSLVKTLALQENKQDTMGNEVYCSMKSSVWLGNFDLSSSCLKMLEIYYPTKTGRLSKKPSFKLPKQGTMQNGQLFQQVIWEPATNESASGLLPTPIMPSGGRTVPADAVREGLSAYKDGKKYQVDLQNHLRHQLLPTPRAGLANNDRIDKPSTIQRAQDPNCQWHNLEIHIARYCLLPTPRTGETSDLTSKPGHSYSLSAWARQEGPYLLPTPTTNDSKNSTLPPSQTDRDGLAGAMLRDDSIPTGAATYLNPSFVEEMMGYPIGWCD